MKKFGENSDLDTWNVLQSKKKLLVGMRKIGCLYIFKHLQMSNQILSQKIIRIK